MPTNQLEELSGIGPVNAQKLYDSGITTPEELYESGAMKAFAAIRSAVDPGACFHLLLALEAAVQDCPKKDLPQERKEELQTWFNSLG